MAIVTKIKVDGTTYDLQDAGALRLTGGTVTGDLIITAPHRDSYYASNLCRHFSQNTPTEFVIKTKIKYASSSYMPVIRIYGYAYGLNCPIELRLGFYVYGGNFGWQGVVSTGAWKPDVYLFTYTENSVEYVAVGLKGSCYFCGFQVDMQIGALGSFGGNISIDGWSTDNNGLDTSRVLVPSVGTNHCIQLTYRPMTTDITGSSTSCSGNAATATSTPKLTLGTSVSSADSAWETSNAGLKIMPCTAAATPIANDGVLINVPYNASGGYGFQIWGDDGSGDGGLATRNKNGGTGWNVWRTIARVGSGATRTAGSATNPVYVGGNGVISACTYSLNKTVPADAKFTDTTYTAGTGISISGNVISATGGGGLPGINTTGADGDHVYKFTDTCYDHPSLAEASIEAVDGKYTDIGSVSGIFLKTPYDRYDEGEWSEGGHGLISLTNSPGGYDPGIAIEVIRGYGTSRSRFLLGSAIEKFSRTQSYLGHSGWALGDEGYDGFCGMFGYGDEAYFCHPYAGIVTMSQLIMHVGGCVMEGTKITMADGSLKAVEQVRVGDRIKSYDFKAGEYTEAVVLLNVNQGASNKFDCNMFANGKTLYTYDVHRVVSDSLENPIPKTTELETGDMVYMADMKRSKFEGTIEYKDNVRKKYYHLISSSGIYFSDGVMSANHPTDKVSVFTQNDIHIDDRLRDQWNIDAVYNKKNKIENPEFIRKSHKLLGEIKVLSRTIEDAKANLSSTDYLNLKHSEGLVDEDAWEQVKAQREAWRQIINVSEGPLEEKNAAMEALREEYGIAPDMKISRRQQFYDSVSGNNALIDVYKEFRKDPAERDAELARKAEEKKIKKLEVTEDEKTEGTDS